MATSFLDLERMHESLDAIFMHHQECLLAGDVVAALEHLDEYARLLQLHMQHEEHHMLPLLESAQERNIEPRGVPAEMYVLEHRKILERLEELRRQLNGFSSRKPITPADIIQMLDSEHSYKLLVEHHNQREHNLLYRQLDSIVSDDRRSELLDQCDQEWSELRKNLPISTATTKQSASQPR